MNHKSPITLLLTCLLLLASCQKYPVREVALNTRLDSVSYAMAYMSGRQDASYIRDSTGQAICDYMASFDQAMKKAPLRSPAFNEAYKMGLIVKEYEIKGLYFRKGFPLNEPIFLQAYVNGLYQDSTTMNEAVARKIYDYYKIKASPYSRLDMSVFSNDCPTAPAEVSLVTNWDSLNYMVGWVNGYRAVKNVPDSVRQATIQGHICGMKKALRTSYDFPSMASRGYGFGAATAQWQQSGRIRDMWIKVNPELFRQGLINGLHEDTTMMTMPQAIKYMRATRPDLFSNDKNH